MEQIPTVDIGQLFQLQNKSIQNAAKDFGDAFRQFGVVYLVNHGIDMDLLNDVLKQSQEFFNLPMEIRNRYAKVNAVEDFGGYSHDGKEILSDKPDTTFEFKQLFDIMVANPKYPAETPEWNASIQKALTASEELKLKLFRLLAVALGVDEEFILNSSTYLDDSKENRPNWTLFRVNKYPRVLDPKSVPAGAVRCAEHTDWDIITFLCQDAVGGLEIKTPDGNWVPVAPVPDSILLNVGQILEIWSRGYFPAVVHRVLLSEEEKRADQDRYSMGFFTFPDDDFQLQPFKKSSLLTNDMDYSAMTVREYINTHIRHSRAY